MQVKIPQFFPSALQQMYYLQLSEIYLIIMRHVACYFLYQRVNLEAKTTNNILKANFSKKFIVYFLCAFHSGTIFLRSALSVF